MSSHAHRREWTSLDANPHQHACVRPCHRGHESVSSIGTSGCGAVGSARRLGRRGRWFESSHPDSTIDVLPSPDRLYECVWLQRLRISYLRFPRMSLPELSSIRHLAASPWTHQISAVRHNDGACKLSANYSIRIVCNTPYQQDGTQRRNGHDFLPSKFRGPNWSNYSCLFVHIFIQ